MALDYNSITTTAELIAAINANFGTPKRPPVTGQDTNVILRKIVEFISTSIKIAEVSSDGFCIVKANCFVSYLFLKSIADSPNVKIGLTEGGDEILPEMPFSGVLPIAMQQYYETDTPIYYAVTGGTISITLEIFNDIF